MRPAGRLLDRAAVAEEFGLEAATLEKLDRYLALLERWNPRINLVSPKSLPQAWHRHVADSLQLAALVPEALEGERGLCPLCDLGSGGGFPGLVLAILGHPVTLIEADQRKGVFLREVARETGLAAEVLSQRIEDYAGPRFGLVSARALAPLPRLFGYLEPVLAAGGVALLPRGRGWQAELTEAAKSWRVRHGVAPSRTDPEAVILTIEELARVA